MTDTPKVTLKLDKRGRLCAWYGNVQHAIVTDDNHQLKVPGEAALCRLEGRDKHDVWVKLSERTKKLLTEHYAVVVSEIWEDLK